MFAASSVTKKIPKWPGDQVRDRNEEPAEPQVHLEEAKCHAPS